MRDRDVGSLRCGTVRAVLASTSLQLLKINMHIRLQCASKTTTTTMSDITAAATSNIADDIRPSNTSTALNHNATRSPKPASEHEARLQLLNIAQELQDIIYEYAFEDVVHIQQQDIDATYSGPPLLSALRTNTRQDIFHRAEEIYYKTASFVLEEEFLVPFLLQRKEYSKHFSDICVWLRNYPAVAADQKWVFKSPLDYPKALEGTGYALVYILAQFMLDKKCATELEEENMSKLYEALSQAGIKVKEDILRVPVFMEYDEGEGIKSTTTWTSEPKRDVLCRWRDVLETLERKRKEEKEAAKSAQASHNSIDEVVDQGQDADDETDAVQEDEVEDHDAT